MMRTQIFAVVSREDDDSVVSQTDGIQMVKYSADVMVDMADHAIALGNGKK